MIKLNQLIHELLNLKSKKGKSFLLAILIISITTLLVTSYYVAQKSATIHSHNTDQLVDGYLFESKEIFQGANFPAAHTFLFKWPIFALSATLGNTSTVYIWLTVITYLVTVMGFLFVIYIITNKNKLVTAFTGLALSNILLLVPVQPAIANFLPVNMAMITTRNLEYLVFFLFIYLMVTTRQIKSWRFATAVIVLTVLGASDKYFLMLGLVGAVLVLFYNIFKQNRKAVVGDFIPLAGTVIAYTLSSLTLRTINFLDITNIPAASSAAPFTIVTSVWQMFEGIAGAIQGIITVYGTDLFGRPVSAHILPYLVNGLVLLVSLYAIYYFLTRLHKGPDYTAERPQFVLWLIMTLFAAIIVFIASNHHYLSDARYLTGAIFAGLATLAYVLSTVNYKTSSRYILLAILALIITTPASLYVARGNYIAAIEGNHQEFGARTDKAADIIESEGADLLVGDYWFAAPVKLKTSTPIDIALMSTKSCDTPEGHLSSEEWFEPDHDTDRTAYYILRDGQEGAETFNHGCTMDYINQKYGEPEDEYIIRGTEEQPIDIIRIYPYDIRTKF